MKIPSLEPIKNMAHKLHDWIFTFGEARRVDPELYDKLMLSFGKRNAGIERAISDFNRLMAGRSITQKDAADLALTYEDKTLAPRPELKELYDSFSKVLENVEKASLEKGIFKERFQDRMIAEIDTEVAILKSGEILEHGIMPVKLPLGKTKKQRIQDLLDERKNLENMRYLPHNIVVERVLESKINQLEGEERKQFIQKANRISSKFKKRTGKGLFRDYLETGLLKPEDLDIRRLTIETLHSYYYRSALKGFGGNKNIPVY